MDNPITFANVSIYTVSMEGAGVSYIPLHSDFNPIFFKPVVIDLDLEKKYKSHEELFNPSVVFFDNYLYYLTKNLNCKLSRSENSYFKIDCPSLKIKVWGNTKEEVIKAFNFNFHSLYKNFVNVPESKLSPGAVRLRDKLKSMVA